MDINVCTINLFRSNKLSIVLIWVENEELCLSGINF